MRLLWRNIMSLVPICSLLLGASCLWCGADLTAQPWDTTSMGKFEHFLMGMGCGSGHWAQPLSGAFGGLCCGSTVQEGNIPVARTTVMPPKQDSPAGDQLPCLNGSAEGDKSSAGAGASHLTPALQSVARRCCPQPPLPTGTDGLRCQA